MSELVTAAMVVIGDEILSGRTKDKNIGFVAEYLTGLGIDLVEVRIVSDDLDAIAEALNAVRSKVTYVFTSGGIGPTHDDITADGVARAFGVPCEPNDEAMALLEAHYRERDMPFTDARKRMARAPEGATLIDNPVSVAPGFKIGNVHVMAGVPKIMQAMMDQIAPTLQSGRKMLSANIDCTFGEGTIGGPLGEIQAAHSDTMIGSYPRFEDGNHTTQIVIRGRDEDAIHAAADAVRDMLSQLD